MGPQILRSVTEQKLIERICLGSKNSKNQAMRKKQSREDEKKELKELMCSPGDSPEMIAAKLSGTYSKWLLTKEGSELKYNEKKFVKGAADSGEWLLSNIMRNNTKSRNQ